MPSAFFLSVSLLSRKHLTFLDMFFTNSLRTPTDRKSSKAFAKVRRILLIFEKKSSVFEH